MARVVVLWACWKLPLPSPLKNTVQDYRASRDAIYDRQRLGAGLRLSNNAGPTRRARFEKWSIYGNHWHGRARVRSLSWFSWSLERHPDQHRPQQQVIAAGSRYHVNGWWLLAQAIYWWWTIGENDKETWLLDWGDFIRGVSCWIMRLAKLSRFWKKGMVDNFQRICLREEDIRYPGSRTGGLELATIRVA